jgi:DNA invertase Pin-like site-specific DNA recombinase
MQNAPIYRRCSTEEQAANANGLNAQEDVCRAYAARNGLNVAGVFTVAKRDRIGRLEPMQMAMIQRAVERKGARILSAANEGTEDDEPSSILMRRMVDAFAEYERLIIGARTKAALGAKRRRAEKCGGPCPFGFERGPDKPGANGQPIKTLVESPVEQEALSLMRSLRAGGAKLGAIAAELTARGIQRREGAVWEHSYLSRLLTKTA